MDNYKKKVRYGDELLEQSALESDEDKILRVEAQILGDIENCMGRLSLGFEEGGQVVDLDVVKNEILNTVENHFDELK